MNFETFCRMMGLSIDALTEAQRAELMKKYSAWNHRNFSIGDGQSFRAFAVAPETFQETNRSVTAVVLTDEPTWMYEYERGWIKEVLPMSTVRMPADNRMPLANTHQLYDIEHILGSCVNCRTEQKARGEFVADLVFSEDEDGDKAMKKVRGGHIRDLSGGYRVFAARYIEENEEFTLDGKTYRGPMKIALDWEPFEGSLCPMGADRFAKIRSANLTGHPSVSGAATKHKENQTMNFEAFCRKLGIDPQTLNSVQRVALEALFESRAVNLTADADLPNIDEIKQRIAPLFVNEPTLPTAEPGAEARAERARISEIRSMCVLMECPDLENSLIVDGVSIDEARKRIFDNLKATRKAVGVTKIEGGLTEQEKFRSAAIDAVALRSGVEMDKPAAGATELRGMSLVRLAEECLIRSGINTRGLNPDQIAVRALSTSDFPKILSNAGNKRMQKSYSEANSNWRKLAVIGEGANFLDLSRPQLSGAAGLQLVNENGEYNEIAFKEIGQTFAIQTYGAVAKLTRQMIINDQLRAFMKVFSAFGRAAERKIADLFFAILTANATTTTLGNGTSNALFSAAHKNISDSTAALGIDALSAMRAKLRVQTDPNGIVLGAGLKHILVPAALETQADMLTVNAVYPAANFSEGVQNPFKGLEKVVEARLDATSTKDFYGFADQNEIETIEVAFLNGVQNPVIVEGEGRNPDVRETICRIDTGVGLLDHRGMVFADVA